MKIAVDALGIHYYGGGRTATLNLFETLLTMDDGNEYQFFLTQHEPSLVTKSGNATQLISPFINRFLVRIWAQLVIPREVRNFNLVHFSKHLGVFGIQPPSLVTIYDMTTLVHPELFPAFDVWYWRTIQRRTLHQAEKIIAISNNTAMDVASYYHIPDEKISIIYPAIADHFQPAPEREILEVRDRYSLPNKYIIHVGRIDKKKNLTMLVRAFDRFRERYNNEINLVLVGEDYPKSFDTQLRPTIEHLGLNRKVIFTGRVPDQDVPALYSGALVTVFPSIHEGFGLAPIEAMACGSPVLGHGAGAFREVAGDAALILDVVGVDHLADGLYQIIEDEELRRDLRKQGISRAANFKPEKTATQTLKIYEEIGKK
jgi:glycosyltransferase involved in cell wall biosynthesis